MARVLAMLATCLVLAGCNSSALGGSGDQGYVSGTGTVTVVPAAQRKAPAAVSGTSLDGKPLALSDYLGKVVVVNVWGSWCTECREEAPALNRAVNRLAAKNVAFLGIDSRDATAATARAYVAAQHITYPSIYDQPGRTLLAFRGTLAPSSIPSTVIVDAQGRVAASVLGPVTTTTLVDLVETVLDKAAT
jgi:thiol-disulfide isomerase/thioredoxin